MTGGLVFAKKGTINTNCDGGECSQTGLNAVNSAKGLGTVSTITFIAGAAALGTGAILFFTEPKKPQPKTGTASLSSRWIRAGIAPSPQGVFATAEGAF
ncbi:Hypothetical protein A7982_05478 [Minicystis rosea]|nr:Hypothetical protein A7982_05478 [Minicystis rosea]